LIERGDPRGELIGLQLGGHETLARVLIAQHEHRWLGAEVMAATAARRWDAGELVACTLLAIPPSHPELGTLREITLMLAEQQSAALITELLERLPCVRSVHGVNWQIWEELARVGGARLESLEELSLKPSWPSSFLDRTHEIVPSLRSIGLVQEARRAEVFRRTRTIRAMVRPGALGAWLDVTRDSTDLRELQLTDGFTSVRYLVAERVLEVEIASVPFSPRFLVGMRPGIVREIRANPSLPLGVRRALVPAARRLGAALKVADGSRSS
jgi:hypothetical protein